MYLYILYASPKANGFDLIFECTKNRHKKDFFFQVHDRKQSLFVLLWPEFKIRYNEVFNNCPFYTFFSIDFKSSCNENKEEKRSTHIY